MADRHFSLPAVAVSSLYISTPEAIEFNSEVAAYDSSNYKTLETSYLSSMATIVTNNSGNEASIPLNDKYWKIKLKLMATHAKFKT